MDLLGTLACVVGFVLLARGWNRIGDPRPRWYILMLLTWAFLHSLSNALEWLNIAPALGEYENYLQVMEPLIWGLVLYAFLMATEISHRRLSELRLMESEGRLTLAVENARIGLWDWDIPSDRLTVNDQWIEMTGYSREELEPISTATRDRLYHPEDITKGATLMREHFREHADYFENEARMRHKDGRWIWVLSRGKVSERDELGRPLRMAGTQMEITKRKLAEQAMSDEAHRRRVMMDTSNDGIVVIDQTHGVVDANEGFAAMLGYTLPELMQLHTWDWEAIMTEPEIRMFFNDLAMTRGIFETRHRRKDGSEYDAEVSASGTVVRGEPLVIAITRDITARKTLERSIVEARDQAEAANLAKSRFLANMSHEIRTPINGVYGMLQLVLGTKLDEEQRRYLSNADQSLKRLTRLLTDILDLSRVEAGRMTLQSEPFNLPGLAAEVCALFESGRNQPAVKLCCEVSPEIPPILVGDAFRVQQILNNMVGNALKFTDEGEVKLEAHLAAPPKDGSCEILFMISDTGIGIPDEKLGSLFNSFVQVSDGYARLYEGAGLGLSICRHLVELMGGSITVDSELGKGTTFYVALPFILGREPLIQAPAKSQEPLSIAFKRALVAEDESVSQLAVAMQLEREGVQVVSVGNGRLALDALLREEFDVVLMDVQMPVMDGIEATRAIRRGDTGEGNRTVPVIALTAYAMTEDIERIMAAGMDMFVTKPVTWLELRAVLAGLSHSKD